MADDFGMGYALGQDSGGNGGMFGGDGWWAIILFALIFGRNGWGGFGGFGGGNDGGCATQADVRAAVDQQTLISKLDQQTYGLADATYALNNAITGGFHGVDLEVCNLGHQISDCCCTTQRAIDAVNYNMASHFCNLGNTLNSNTRDIIDNANSNTRAILDFLTNDKIETLRAENEALRLKASQSAQNQYLIDQLRPCPVPAYITCNPYAASWGTGYNSGCGCGCG